MTRIMMTRLGLRVEVNSPVTVTMSSTLKPETVTVTVATVIIIGTVIIIESQQCRRVRAAGRGGQGALEYHVTVPP